MKIIKIVSGILALLALVLIAIAPVGPLPGVFIGGTSTDSPVQWPDTSAVHEIKLKVPGTLPRVVIIWVIDHKDELYVAGSSDSGWVKMVGEGAPVDMRLADNTYSLTASLMREGWEPMLQAYVNKYQPDYPDIVASFSSSQEAQGQMSVFKLSR
ncbi:MAG: hypothetical protein ACI9P7_000614 [Candidatus Azotimanducaceae bacterium]|jgi:hypothetical protein